MRAALQPTRSNIEITSTPANAAPPSPGGQPAASIRLSQPPRREAPGDSDMVKQSLRDLAAAIHALKDNASPDFSELLTICEQLKGNEALLKQASIGAQASHELHQLRTLLPSLFRQVERGLDIHRDTPLDLRALQTLCMGLSVLAAPLPGPLLTGAQCQAARPLLTSLSNKLAEQLSAQLEHQAADNGLLLNCLNWFSRALKADLLQGDQPAVAALFQSSLEQMHAWSGLGNAASLNSRQLAKCLVQLNTMIRQHLIDTDPASAVGRANRAAWTECVNNLCHHFLSHDQWLQQCSGVELINVTNTLKDGLELGLLDGSAPVVQSSFDRIAARIGQQTFAGPASLTALSNCANFLRSLFEHQLLGGSDSPTGEAVRHVIREIGRLHQYDDLSAHQAQALINLASFIKAADRWLSSQPRVDSESAGSPLVNASASLIEVFHRQQAGDCRWMQSAQSGSSLLWALQHLAQRGLLQGQAVLQQQSLVQQLLAAIPHWRNRTHTPAILQGLRALMSLAKGTAAQTGLQQTEVFRQALVALLDQLQQSTPAELSEDELRASLEAVQTAVMRGVLSLDACQPLLQRLLKSATPVDLTRLEQAIAHYGESPEPIAPVSEQALAPASAATAVSPPKPVPIRGATYRADVRSPTPAPAVSALHESANADNQDWIMPSRVAKPGAVVLLSTETTRPTLKSRPAGKSLAAPAEPVSVKPAARSKKEKSGLTLLQAQKEWFALVTSNDAKALPRLQELAAGYPDLLNQKAPGKKGQSALFHALTQGRKEIVAWLIAHEQQSGVADLGTFLVEAQDEIGIVEKRHVAAIRLLLDSAVKRYDQKTSDAHARQLPDAPLLSRKALLERRTALLSDPHKAALGQSAQLRPLLEEYKLIEPQRAISPAGSTAKKPVTTTSILRPIATHAARQSSETNLGMTPLMQATVRGDTEQIKAILGAASDKDKLAQARQINGATALMMAAGSGDAQTTAAILNDVTDKDTLAQMRDHWGMTALMRAAIGGNADTVTAILSAVKNKDTLAQMQDSTQMTALLSATLSNRADVVMALLKGVGDKDAMAQIKESQGATALMCATLLGHAASVKAVLEYVDDKDTLVRSRDIHGVTALMRAAISGHAHLVQLILNAVDDKDTAAQMADGEGITALMRAASSGSLESTMTILNSVSRKSELAQQRDARGMTAAMRAVSAGHPAIAAAISDAVKG